MTRVIVRADAGPSIGSGHVMRAVALAEALHGRGAEVVLMASGIPSRLRDYLGSVGIAIDDAAIFSRDPRDAAATIAAANEGDALSRWVVADGPLFDSVYMRQLLDAGLRVGWVDDLNALPTYPCDIVVNPTLGAERCLYSGGADTRALAGGSYAFIRRAFADAAQHSGRRGDGIVVALGGADPYRLTPRVLRALLKARLGDAHIDVVVGPSNPNVGEVIEAAKGVPHVTVLQDPADWPSLLARAALVVTAAGITTWELAALGVPMILLVVVEGQLLGATTMEEAEAAEVIRMPDDLDQLTARVASLWNDGGRRLRMADRGKRLIDCLGASRVARWIVQGVQPETIVMRPARREDALQVWRINSEPSVRAQSFDGSPIPLARHFEWFDARLAEASVRMYLLVQEDEVAAQVRYDRLPDDGGAEVSFAVASPFRRLGLGTRILENSWRLACDELQVSAVRGFVIAGNMASAAVFRRAGFVEIGREMRMGRECLVFERCAA